jgi:class 3 adenylate cyclase
LSVHTWYTTPYSTLVPLKSIVIIDGLLSIDKCNGQVYLIISMENHSKKPPVAPQGIKSKISRHKKLEQEQYKAMLDLYSHYQDGTFLSLDIVSSTKLKEGESSLAVINSFQAFQAYIKEHIARAASTVFSGDGVMCLFKDPQRAVDTALKILQDLTQFNQQASSLKRDFNVRIGINSGPILMEETSDLGTVTEQTIDIAGHLQKYGKPGRLLISRSTWDHIQQQDKFIKEWRKIDKTEVYRYQQDFIGKQQLNLPVRVGDTLTGIAGLVRSGIKQLGGVFLYKKVNKPPAPASPVQALSAFFKGFRPTLINNRIAHLGRNHHLGLVQIKDGDEWEDLPSRVYLVIPPGKNTRTNVANGVKANRIIPLDRDWHSRYNISNWWGLSKTYVETRNGYYIFFSKRQAKKFLKARNR